jgi:hypothetical protein
MTWQYDTKIEDIQHSMTGDTISSEALFMIDNLKPEPENKASSNPAERQEMGSKKVDPQDVTGMRVEWRAARNEDADSEDRPRRIANSFIVRVTPPLRRRRVRSCSEDFCS